MPTQTEQAVRTQIQAMILELAPNPARGSVQDALLVEDLEYHSLALLELAFALEDEFDLPPIDEKTAQSIRSARDIEEYVVQQLAARAQETPTAQEAPAS